MVTIDLAAGQPVAQGLGRRSTSRPGKGPSKAQQSRRLEAAAQRLPEPELAAARAAFAQLDLAAQWQLASELAVSREPEFAH